MTGKPAHPDQDFSSIRLPKSVLEPLCQPFRRQADCLLELYAMTEQPVPPSDCLQCFFRLLGTADGPRRPALEPLKQWIESHIEIAVEADDSIAVTFPVALAEPDLESFCFAAIHRVREDTAIESPLVRLGLRYRQTSPQALPRAS